MASSPSTDAGAGPAEWPGWFSVPGLPIAGPGEWEPAYLSVETSPVPWTELMLTRNGRPLALTQRRLGGGIRTVAEWPRSNPGRYDLRLQFPGGVAHATVTITPAKITSESFRALLDDLHTHLPASIALSLQRAGGLAGIDVAALKPATPAEELYRLKRAVEGTGVRPGLRQLLPTIARAPHEVLEAQTVMVRRELLKRPHPASLVRALATASNVGADRQPLRLPDERVHATRDVYENRVVRAGVEAVTRRLRHLSRVWNGGGELGALQGRLREARRAAPFLEDVGDLTAPPTRVTMVLLRRREYRAALELLLELNRSLQVSLDDPRLEGPMENLPSLYQTWCTLQVTDVLLQLAVERGYEVTAQQLSRTLPGSLLIQLLPDGQPVLSLRHRASGRRVTLTPERTFGRTTTPVHSVSFSQRPDLVIEVREPSGAVALWVLDPKYKLDSEASAALDGEPTGKPKKTDIDKMHAYRDALRGAGEERVVSFAAILYPGPDRVYAPGLAALSAVPMAGDALRTQLRHHLAPVFAGPQRPADQA